MECAVLWQGSGLVQLRLGERAAAQGLLGWSSSTTCLMPCSANYHQIHRQSTAVRQGGAISLARVNIREQVCAGMWKMPANQCRGAADLPEQGEAGDHQCHRGGDTDLLNWLLWKLSASSPLRENTQILPCEGPASSLWTATYTPSSSFQFTPL